MMKNTAVNIDTNVFYGSEQMESHRTSRTTVRRKYKVKSKFRFITSMVILMAMILGVGAFVTGSNDSIALTKESVVTEYVDAGETLWSIAKEYKSEKTDTRKAVYKICKANDIHANELQPGMVLVIPDNI